MMSHIIEWSYQTIIYLILNNHMDEDICVYNNQMLAYVTGSLII